jgi:hypothetical protein
LSESLGDWVTSTPAPLISFFTKAADGDARLRQAAPSRLQIELRVVDVDSDHLRPMALAY